jgi:putative addiction module component (TIGR02574 family)
MDADNVESTEGVVLPARLREEVEKRLAEHDKDPSATLSREEFWRRVDARECE